MVWTSVQLIFNPYLNAMKKLFYFNLLLLTVLACQPVNPVFEVTEQKLALEEFKSLAKDKAIEVNNVLVQENNRLGINNSSYQEFTEADLNQKLKPLIATSQKLLLSYGFAKDEIIDEFGSFDASEIIYMAFAVAGFSEQAKYENLELAASSTNLFGVNVLYASNIGDFYNCALRALGVEALWALYTDRVVSSFAARKALIKAVGKAAARLGLGYIGVAWAVADFVACMWDNDEL